MGGLFGGGSQDSTQTVVNQLPAYIEQGGQQLFQQAQNLASNPYVPYTAPRIAPLSGNQQAAISLAGQNVGNYQPYLDAASGLASSAVGLGQGAQVGADYALAQGDYSNQLGQYATSLGDYAQGYGQRASALGDVALGYGDYALGFGDYVQGAGDYALGQADQATGYGNYAQGFADYAGNQADYVNQLAAIAAQQGFEVPQRAWDATAPFDQEAAEYYMNPYAEGVIDVAADNMWERYGMRLNELGGEAVAQGALGGARHGIENAELGESTIQDIGNTYLTGMNQAYLNAQQQFGADRNARLAAINTGLAGTNVGLGAGQLGLGAGQLGLGAGQLGLGIGQLNLGAGQLGLGAGQLGLGMGQLGLGAGNLAVNAGQLDLGAGNLAINAGQLGLGAAGAANQAGQLGLGAGQLSLGMGQIANQSAATIGNLGGIASQGGVADLQGLLATGDLQRQLQQAQLSTAYQDFLNQQQWPYQQLNFASSILNGVPYSTTQTTNASTPGPDTFGQLLGLGGTLGGAYLLGGGGGAAAAPGVTAAQAQQFGLGTFDLNP